MKKAALLLASVLLATPAGAQMVAPPGERPAATSPHDFRGENPPPSRSEPDPSVARGSVEVMILDEAGQGLGGVSVELKEQFESIASGSKSSARKAVTDHQGKAVFSDLPLSLRHSFSIAAVREGASYSVPSFRLSEKFGQAVTLPTYPVVHSIEQAFVGLRGFIYVEIADDAFRFDVLYRVFNLSRVTWLAHDVKLRLPKGFQALKSESAEGAPSFEVGDGGPALRGAFSPGQHDVRFQFQLPKGSEATESFELGVLPRVAELRVLAQAIPGMSLSVEGFETPEPAEGPDGKKVLITRRVMQAGSGEMRVARLRLDGLPTVGPLRNYVSLIGIGLFALGISLYFRRRGKAERKSSKLDREKAISVLVREIVKVEAAHRSGGIGPETYQQIRGELVDAVARLSLVGQSQPKAAT